MADRNVVINDNLALEILDILRLTPIYTLLHTDQVDELGDDFKPYKWEGFEMEHAEKAEKAHKALLSLMSDQLLDKE